MLASLQGFTIANIWHIHYGWSPVIFEHYVIICMMRLIMRGGGEGCWWLGSSHSHGPTIRTTWHNQKNNRSHSAAITISVTGHLDRLSSINFHAMANVALSLSLSRHFNTLHYHNHYRTITLISKTIYVVFSKGDFHSLNSKKMIQQWLFWQIYFLTLFISEGF